MVGDVTICYGNELSSKEKVDDVGNRKYSYWTVILE
jgi:hypothetical protein